MEQLSQLSELLCAILQIFTSGAAQKSLKLDMAKMSWKINFKKFFQHFVIRTHATLLLQLSKPFFWQLQIFASGAAQKSLKLEDSQT